MSREMRDCDSRKLRAARTAPTCFHEGDCDRVGGQTRWLRSVFDHLQCHGVAGMGVMSGVGDDASVPWGEMGLGRRNRVVQQRCDGEWVSRGRERSDIYTTAVDGGRTRKGLSRCCMVYWHGE